MSKCRHCPVKDGPCVAESPGWEFACKRAESGTAADRAFIVNRSAMGAGTFVAPSTPTVSEAPAAPRDWSGWRRVLRLGALNCWYASKDLDCGCNGFKCHALGRLATSADCLVCLAPAREKPADSRPDSAAKV